MEADTPVEPLNPLADNWGSMYFGPPEIHDAYVRWVAAWAARLDS